MTNKKFLVWTLVLLFSVSVVSAALSDDQLAYYTMDDADIDGNNVHDVVAGSFNATNNGGTTGVTGRIGQAIDLERDDSDDFIDIPNNYAIFDGTTSNFTVNIWFKAESLPGSSEYFITMFEGERSLFAFIMTASGGSGGCAGNVVRTAGLSGGNICGTTTISTGTWYMATLTYDTSGNGELYINNVSEGTSSAGSISASSGDSLLGADDSDSNDDFDGVLDEFAIWNRALSSAEIDSLYNDGSGLQYPYVQSPALTNPEFNPANPTSQDTINATSNYNHGDVSSPSNITVTWTNSTNSHIKNTTFLDVAHNTTVNDGLVCPDFAQCYNGETLTATFNATDANGRSTQVSNTVLIGLNLTIHAETPAGDDVDTFTANITNVDTEDTFQKSTTTNNVSLFLSDGNYTVLVKDASQGGTEYAEGSINITLENATQTETVVLQLTNSFNIEFYDEQTEQLIDDRNITVEFVSDLESSTYNTSNGTLFVDAFMPAEIEIIYNAPGYFERSYYQFLSNQSFNNLTLYLLNNTENTVIVENVDESGAEVQGVTFQLLRGFITGGVQEYRIVEMDKTDFAGEAVIHAELNDPLYKFRVLRNVSEGEILQESDPFEVTNTLLQITINLLGETLAGFNTWRNLQYTTPVWNATAETWTATYTDTQGLINPGGEVCLVVEKTVGVEMLEVGEQCSSATSATFTVTQSDSNHGSIAKLTAETNTDLSTHVLSTAQELIGVRQQLADSLGSTGAFLAIGIVYTVGAILLFNPTTYIFGTVIGFFAAFAIGLINVTWGSSLAAMLIIGGIIAFLTRT